MKQVRNTQLEFGKIRIENIELNLKPREDIPVKRGFSGEHYLDGKKCSKHVNKIVHSGRYDVDKQAGGGMHKRSDRVVFIPIDSYGITHDHVNSNATVYAGKHSSYEGVFDRHQTVRHKVKEFVDYIPHTTCIKSVWVVLRHCYTRIYHWSMKHCFACVDEFTFRLNENDAHLGMQDQLNNLFGVMAGKTTTYQELTP